MADAESTVIVEEETVKASIKSRRPDWCLCKVCHRQFMYNDELLVHMREEHGIVSTADRAADVLDIAEVRKDILQFRKEMDEGRAQLSAQEKALLARENAILVRERALSEGTAASLDEQVGADIKDK